MIREVAKTAVMLDDPLLLFRANVFLHRTEGRDV
jgi:hypothetical protein